MVAKETLDGIEKTLDVIEDQLDTIERIPKVHLNGTTKKQQLVILGVTAVFSALSGSAVTYYFANRHLKYKYEQLASEEIAEARRFYKAGPEFVTPESATEALGVKVEPTNRTMDAVIDELNYRSSAATEKPVPGDIGSDEVVDIEVEADPGVVVKVKTREPVEETQTVEEFDLEVDTVNRDPAYPYVISLEEFLENEPDHDQVDLTYYEGGSSPVLADDKDSIIDNPDPYVGEANLDKFGHGSGEPHIVYVRNERVGTGMDFCISRSPMSIAEKLGFDVEEKELRHSDRTPLRFRD